MWMNVPVLHLTLKLPEVHLNVKFNAFAQRGRVIQVLWETEEHGQRWKMRDTLKGLKWTRLALTLKRLPSSVLSFMLSITPLGCLAVVKEATWWHPEPFIHLISLPVVSVGLDFKDGGTRPWMLSQHSRWRTPRWWESKRSEVGSWQRWESRSGVDTWGFEVENQSVTNHKYQL